VLAALVGGDVSRSTRAIVLDFRLPRTLAGLIAGAALGVAGLQMQTIFRNPLAGPYVLGLSSGASLGVAVVTLAGASAGLALGAWTAAVAALVGAALVLLLVLLVAARVADSVTVLIVGLMAASFASAAVSILQYFASTERLQAFVFWTFGSLSAVGGGRLAVLALLVGAGLMLGALLVKPLNAWLLGERYAQTMGVPIKAVRWATFASTSLLAGGVTAFCGPIAFVGLAVPHVARALTGSADHRLLLPMCALSGGALLVACDLVARLPGSDWTLPLNAITSLVGAPFVIVLIVRGRRMARFF
jgi:iron complex transport system permease protein